VTNRRNLIVVRAGDDSLHRRWIEGDARSFDLMVSYFGEMPGRFKGRAEHYNVIRGPRWPAHDWLWRHQREIFDRYERVAFVCDDVDARTADWNQLFALAEWYALDLAHPAIVGYPSMPITAPVDRCLLRYVDRIDVMCPVMSRQTLARVGDTFGESVSGWGLTRLWAERLPYPAHRSAIVDRVRVAHATPVRQGSLRPVLDRLGIEPHAEVEALLARHGLEHAPPREHARLSLP
jgi:hypothetical protein